ncbi:hypothetical protein Q4F19_08180 [Sphingomonas sp. BIUV-7]|uniref:Uncharacterized protein n=1 Tax=Sphingomonas natans TaxID=3063330 RepID=A0ABT8Y7Q4_9SPHN|nr:hypothetical protein [Sphingomonas sp. BIUV-7]MDO6414355.1 hypothetical protein [Sphingomonas sp. BIUV-7]
MAEEKLFGKYNEFVLLLSGFVLTGLIGSYISQRYSREAATSAFASSVFKDTTAAIGKRMMATSSLLNALQSEDDANGTKSAKLEVAMDRYRDGLQVWNSERTYLREMVSTYYGTRSWETERKIHYHFRALGDALERAYKTGKADYPCLKTKRDKMLDEVSAFAGDLSQALDSGRIGSDADHGKRNKIRYPDTVCVIR